MGGAVVVGAGQVLVFYAELNTSSYNSDTRRRLVKGDVSWKEGKQVGLPK